MPAAIWSPWQRGDSDDFLRLDVEFHAAILKASGNTMFAQFQTLVAEILTGRTEHGLMPHLPHHEALQLHVDVASAIQRGEAAAAHAAMSGIVEQFAEEVGHIWSEHHQGEAPDARADQFSLGVLTFLLLSGRLPWNHASLSAAAAPAVPLTTP